MRFSAGELAAAVDGRLVGPDVEVGGVSIDSRGDNDGRLFVPLVAERDGHEFIPHALRAGAAAYLTARGVADVPGPDAPGATAIEVADTQMALAAVGRLARDRLGDRVIGVTGSVGKTSVKDLLAAVLATTYRTAASQRSFNNELGVPLTLANAALGTEAAVIEMGARGIGHIELLCGIARPVVGVVTAVGHVHTELFGRIEDVARGKGELVESLPSSGTAVLNADDHRVLGMASRTRATVVRYSVGAAAGVEVMAEDVVLDRELHPRFRLRTPWGDADVRLHVRGHHQVANALAAAAAALAVGTPVAAVADGLADASLSPWRMDLQRTAMGALVLNDSYNANPLSMAAALRSLAHLEAGRRVAVLGTMAELGPVAEQEHRAVAALAASLDVEVLAVAEPRYGVRVVEGIDEAVDEIGVLGPDDAVLVKGSRSAGLERLAELLLD